MLKKFFLIYIFMSFCLCHSAWSEELSLWEKKYGENLVNIPIPLRQQFMLATGQYWSDASLAEQSSFLDARDLQRQERVAAREEKLLIKKMDKEDAQRREDERLAALEAEHQAEAAKKEEEIAERERKAQKLRALKEQREARMQEIRARNGR